MKEIIIQITAGRGPAECSWVVAQLLKVLLKEWKGMGIQAETLVLNKGEMPRTLQSAAVLLRGGDLSSVCKEIEGSVLWIGKSPYRKFHKRKNWFVGVGVFNNEKAEGFKSSDLKYQTFRSSGPGGQAVNKVESAVRVTYLPTGISVSAQDSRSQLENKKLALKRLKEKLEKLRLDRLSEEADDRWNAHLNLERGNPVRVYEGEKFRLKKQN